MTPADHQSRAEESNLSQTFDIVRRWLAAWWFAIAVGVLVSSTTAILFLFVLRTPPA